LEAGYSITGDVIAYSSADTLALGGSANSSFDVSHIGAQYEGFGIFEKTGSSAWSLDNSTTAVTPWEIVGGTLDLAASGSAGASTGAITFEAGGSATLKIESAALPNGTSFSNPIQGFAASDVIDLAGLTFAAGASASYNAGDDVLMVTSGGITDTLTVGTTLTQPVSRNFQVSSDGHDGTEITLIGILHHPV
jgi:fibronectin-binding autotransporter adhesin